MINLLKKIQFLFITPKNNVDIDSNSISTSESIESNIELIGRERLAKAIQLEEEDAEDGDVAQYRGCRNTAGKYVTTSTLLQYGMIPDLNRSPL